MHLDHVDVDLLFEQVGGKAVTQGVHRDALVDQRHVGSRADGAVELAHGQRIHGIESGNSHPLVRIFPWAWAAPSTSCAAARAAGREHRVAVLAALALLDAQRHALAVDVGDLQADDLARTQARAVGQRQRGVVLQVRDRASSRATSSWLSTTGRVCGTRTGWTLANISPRLSVTSKKNFNAVSVALIVIGEAPWSTMCS